jgi:hypothetical protein
MKALTWSAASQWYQYDADAICIISPGGVTHGSRTCRSALIFQAPRDGAYYFYDNNIRPSTQGDGSWVSVSRFTGGVWSDVWPNGAGHGEYQWVRPKTSVVAAGVVVLAQGDLLVFWQDGRADPTFDSVARGIVVTDDQRAAQPYLTGALTRVVADSRSYGVAFFDGSLAPVNFHERDASGPLYRFFSSSNWGQTHFHWRGSLTAPFQTSYFGKTGRTAEQFFPNLRQQQNLPNRTREYWIVNNYRNPANNHLLAILHEEISPSATDLGADRVGGVPRTFALALAYSKDGGATYQILGDVITARADREADNIAGAPYVVDGGFLYVYYREHDITSVARADLAAVLANAEAGRPTAFKKYCARALSDRCPAGDVFQTPGLGGEASTIYAAAAYDDFDFIVHGDAIKITTVGAPRYVIGGYSQATTRSVKLIAGSSPYSFGPPVVLNGEGATHDLMPYISIVPLDANAEHGDGGSSSWFAVYWSWGEDFDTGGRMRELFMQYVYLMF